MAGRRIARLLSSGPPNVPPLPAGSRADEPDVTLLESLEAVIARLSPRSADVLRRRLGQSPEGSETLQEIGDCYELSRERVRQIEHQAIKRLRSAARLRSKTGPEQSIVDVKGCLALSFQSPHPSEPGRYLRATFPEANAGVLGRVLEAFGPATSAQVIDWIKAFERSRAVEIEHRRQQHNREERWARVASGTLWPGAPSIGGWFPHAPCRPPRLDDGHRWSEKLGRNAQYDSALEEGMLDVFDRSPDVLTYCEQPFEIEYAWFHGTRGYVPDFAVRLADGRSILIEAKPRTLWADGVNVAKWNAAIRWCEQNGWGFQVSDNRGHPGELIASADATGFAALEKLTADGPAPWAELRRHWFDPGRSWTTLLATSLRFGFVLLRNPFEVRRARRSPWLDALNQSARATDAGPA